MERRELIPGYKECFSESGIDGDAFNVWSPKQVLALIGDFESMTPAEHYDEYFQKQGKKYEQVGRPGLHAAIMENSNPTTVAAFDQLVDEFNEILDDIKVRHDVSTVKEFAKRAYDLFKRKSA